MRGRSNNDLAGGRNGEVGARNQNFFFSCQLLLRSWKTSNNFRTSHDLPTTDCGCKFSISKIVHLTPCFSCVLAVLFYLGDRISVFYVNIQCWQLVDRYLYYVCMQCLRKLKSVRAGRCHYLALHQNDVAASATIASWHAASGRVADRCCKRQKNWWIKFI